MWDTLQANYIQKQFISYEEKLCPALTQPPFIYTDSTYFTFKNINNALKDVVDWNGLGAELGISYVKIKEIEKNNQKQVAECRRDLIQHWMEKDVSGSWQKLCDALTNMGQSVLACKIRQTYCSTYPG